MKERIEMTMDQILRLRAALSEEFGGEEGLKEELDNLQKIRQDPREYSLSEKDQALIDLFLLAMRIPAPPDCEQEARKN